MDRFSFLKSIPQSPLIGLNIGRSILFAFLGLFVLFLGYFLGQMPMLFVVLKEAGNMEAVQHLFYEYSQTNDISTLGLSSNQGFALLLLSFVGMAVLFLPFFGMVYKIPLRRLWTVASSMRWSRVFWGFGLILGITFLLEIGGYLMAPELYIWQFDPSTFPVLLLICLLILPIQTSMEEIALRGFLLPHVSHWFGRAWIGVLITSLSFGLMHMANPEVAEYGVWNMLAYYCLSGVFLGLMTVLDDGLEMALGVHFGVNLFSASMVSYEGAVIQTDTLFMVTETDIGKATLVFLAIAVIFLWISGKVFGWKWKDLLSQKIEYDEDEDDLELV